MYYIKAFKLDQKYVILPTYILTFLLSLNALFKKYYLEYDILFGGLWYPDVI